MLFVSSLFDQMTKEVLPTRWRVGCCKVWDGGELVVKYDVKLGTEDPCLDVEYKGNRSYMARQATKIYTGAGTRFLFGCPDCTRLVDHI